MNEKVIRNITVGGIATNCWIYPLDSRPRGGQSPCVLIDPGDEGNRVISFLDREHLFPVYIVLTHGHFDHIGALPVLAAEYSLRRKAGGQAEQPPLLAIHAEDSFYLGPDALPFHYRSLDITEADEEYIRQIWSDMPPSGSPPPVLPQADIILSEGDSIGPFTVLHLPGHTRGSIGLWDKEAGVLFSGDTLFRGDRGRTDLPGGSDEQIVHSLRRLFAMDPAIKVYPGHGPTTVIGVEASRADILI